jgi:hypothetical protein
MMTIQAKNFNGQTHGVTYDMNPDRCPLCHHALDPKIPGSVAILRNGDPDTMGTILEIVYQCTRRTCSGIFIGRFTKTALAGRVHGTFQLRKTAPTNFVEPDVANEIREVSPEFVTIFSQASAAAASELNQIAGCGYRRALEFLIKDYCISKDESAREAIQKELLGTTIKNRVSDPNVKQCAKRATWLGNDETHYVKKWEDKDITDLKTLIELTMNWIRSSVLTERYLREMAEPHR